MRGLIILSMLLTGCTQFTGDELERVQQMCERRGGVVWMVYDRAWFTVRCGNTMTIMVRRQSNENSNN